MGAVLKGTSPDRHVSMTSTPYKWICFLTVKTPSGGVVYASGFKTHLPDVNRTAIVTAGHSIYIHFREDGEYAAKVTVKSLGHAAIEVGSNDLFVAPEYRTTGTTHYDHGLILLPGKSGDGFGWSAIIDDEELNDRSITICGYPSNKPRGMMWITGGNISSYTANRIFYMNDTMGGQSGIPVYWLLDCDWRSQLWRSS